MCIQDISGLFSEIRSVTKMNFYPKDTKDTEGLTINNLNKFLVRYFEDQALSGLNRLSGNSLFRDFSSHKSL